VLQPTQLRAPQEVLRQERLRMRDAVAREVRAQHGARGTRFSAAHRSIARGVKSVEPAQRHVMQCALEKCRRNTIPLSIEKASTTRGYQTARCGGYNAEFVRGNTNSTVLPRRRHTGYIAGDTRFIVLWRQKGSR